jgi:hypothetical protein
MCYDRLYASHEVSNAARQARARAANQAQPVEPAAPAACPDPVESGASVRAEEAKILEHV